ncbi:MAG: hypothetical protein AAB864_01135 [Patescibacteria group bacterium]
MAFATSNVRSCSLGGNLRLTVGDWTGAQADAAGTLTVAAGKVYGAQFLPNITSGESQANISISPSGTAGIVTITVYNVNAVTAGTFNIIHA